MSVNKENGAWSSQFRYKDRNGVTRHKHKRGFATEAEALAYEQDFLKSCTYPAAMTFSEFVVEYTKDVKGRVRPSTWDTKERMIRLKLEPFFGKIALCDITPKDVLRWQNLMQEEIDKQGRPYSQAYLRAMNDQLCTLLNHAVRYYQLPSNPAKAVSKIGSAKSDSMQIWTKEEYLRFVDCLANKPHSYYAFEILYWTGIRLGELLALTPEDFDFERSMLSISKSCTQKDGKVVIGPPKTEKSYRMIAMPHFLRDEIQEYVERYAQVPEGERIFTFTKSFMHHEMNRGCKKSGVRRIRIHDLRHSHVSLLINLGFSAVAIADRMGHESIEVTYRYAHLFPDEQGKLARVLDKEMTDDVQE